MSFEDIFKKSFLDGYASTDISIYTAAVSMAITACLALYIFFVYRILTRKTFYSKSFNIALAAISVITSAVIITIQSSIVVSLGMVGALSIVRFRTAIKDPLDLMFLFWAIVVGIICGVGLANIAVLLCLIITLGLVVLDRIPVARVPLMLIVNSEDLDAEERILKSAKKYARHMNVKSRNMTQNSLDLIIELRTDFGSDLLKDVLALEGVTSASLISHDGEATF